VVNTPTIAISVSINITFIISIVVIYLFHSHLLSALRFIAKFLYILAHKNIFVNRSGAILFAIWQVVAGCGILWQFF
jgi:hypothetical protein